MEKIFLQLLPQLIPMMTPALREIIVQGVKEFRKRAKETSNPIDDFIAELLWNLVKSCK
jgi:hypothetical protein